MLERRGSLVLAVICACTACPPLRQPPDSLLAAYTLNHTVPLELYYVDDSNKGKGRLFLQQLLARDISPFTYRHTLQVFAV